MDKAQGNTQTDMNAEKLEQYFLEITEKDICLAFSGGVDSSLLLKAAVDAATQNGSQVYAVTFDSRLHPSCDLKIAREVAGELGGIHQVIQIDELEQDEIRSNPVNRCYLCKRHLFKSLKLLQNQRVWIRFWTEPMRMICMCTARGFWRLGSWESKVLWQSFT